MEGKYRAGREVEATQLRVLEAFDLGLGLRLEGSGLGVQGLGLRFPGLRFRI